MDPAIYDNKTLSIHKYLYIEVSQVTSLVLVLEKKFFKWF